MAVKISRAGLRTVPEWPDLNQRPLRLVAPLNRACLFICESSSVHLLYVQYVTGIPVLLRPW
jgi:hypothetical protein